ncbi:hypothetical protein IAT38_002799 [Cryptococcus sp. DSM 104549]
MPALPTQFPPTPSPSIHSPTKQTHIDLTTPSKHSMMAEREREQPGGSLPAAAAYGRWRSNSYHPHSDFPPTPPVHDSEHDGSVGGSSSVNFAEPAGMSTTRAHTHTQRRPLSAYPHVHEEDQSFYAPPRQYTDPTPMSGGGDDGEEDEGESGEGERDAYGEQNQQLDVDLDAYSATEFDTEEGMDDEREPTLSFVTASTSDSTTGTPSMGIEYGYPPHHALPHSHGGKGGGDVEPRIRMRSTAGRENAYSSAESSLGSGAYSYHGYSEQVYQAPPPLPHIPAHVPGAYGSSVGLGITTDFPTPVLVEQHQAPHQQQPRSEPPSQAQALAQAQQQASRPPLSPSHSFTHRPWQRNLVNRLRSDSASSSFTVASTSTSDSAPSSSRIPPPDSTYHYMYDGFSLPYEQEVEAEAVAMVNEGRERILDMEKLQAMGGVGVMTEETVRSLAGVTHLLLSGCGSHILTFLPRLLSVLAPSLVVLDLSHNDLSFIPETLRYCLKLEELNVADNPLMQLPPWVGDMTGLRMLVLDGCGVHSLPVEVSRLYALHTLCVRRNKLLSLPSWLCLLNQLETLKVDGNPFTPEWAAIVPPILAPSAPSTALPSRSNSHHRHLSLNNGLRSPASVAPLTASLSATSIQQQPVSAASSSYITADSIPSAPNSAAQSAYHLSSLGPIAEDHPPAPPHSAPPQAHTQGHAQGMLQGVIRLDDDLDLEDDDAPLPSPQPIPEAQSSSQRGLRKMRSAGSLLRLRTDSPPAPDTKAGAAGVSVFTPPPADRYSSLGAGRGRRAASAMGQYADDGAASPRMKPLGQTAGAAGSGPAPNKTGKWGFLRKMSMKSLKGEKDKAGSVSASAAANLKSLPPLPAPAMRHQNSDPIRPVVRPQFNGAMSAATLPTRRIMDFEGASEFGQVVPSPGHSPGFGPGAGMGAATMPVGGMATPERSASLGMVGVGSMAGSVGAGSIAGSTVGPSTIGPSSGAGVRGKRRSFLPIDGPPSINVHIPSSMPFSFATPDDAQEVVDVDPTPVAPAPPAILAQQMVESPVADATADAEYEERYAKGLETIKLILQDLHDLSRKPVPANDGFVIGGSGGGGGGSADSSYAVSTVPSDHHPGSPRSKAGDRTSFDNVRQARRPTLDAHDLRGMGLGETPGPLGLGGEDDPSCAPKKFKNDKTKRAKILREIWATERTYVRTLGELITIYVRPASQPVNPNKSALETVVPASERKIVFGGLESILAIHKENFLPALEKAVASLVEQGDDEQGELSTQTAYDMGEVFRTYIAYMKQYSTYITNFDNALSRMKTWSTSSSGTSSPAYPASRTPGGGAAPSISAAAISVGISAIALPATGTQAPSGLQMTTSQRKRVKAFLKKCKEHPMHSQISLESYLLLPIQRIPRYKMLLTELALCTPARSDGLRDTIDDALTEIASLASLMNEEKRDADSRLRLLDWQKRFDNAGRSPLVQPHRRLIMEGPLRLFRIVKKAAGFAECEAGLDLPGADGDMGGAGGEQTITPSKTVVPVEFVKPETVAMEVMLILCSDMMVLATATGPGAASRGGEKWAGQVHVFNVLRMGTMHEPASLAKGNTLRVVDNTSIYYFQASTYEKALQWCRAINSARR